MNNILEKLKKFFKKNDKKISNKENIWEKIEENISEFELDSKLLNDYNFDNLCKQCKLNNNCKAGNKPCELFFKNNGEYNFIVIDDNYGVIESIKDIIEDLKQKNIISKNWQIHYYYTKQAPIYLLKDIKRRNLIPDAGLIDITYGSILRIKEKNIKINGVHILDFILKVNPNFNFYFYTGNTLNPYIKTVKMMMDFFKKIYKKDMDDYIISKNFQDEKDIYKIIKKIMLKTEGRKV